MTSLTQFIAALVAGLPAPVGSAETGTRVIATRVELDVPIESRIASGAELHASLPRGRMATGIFLPLGRIAARFELQGPPAASHDEPSTEETRA